MVWITIQNQVNQSDKPIEISSRRKNQVSGDVFEKVSHSNSRFDALDALVLTVHSVKVLVVNEEYGQTVLCHDPI